MKLTIAYLFFVVVMAKPIPNASPSPPGDTIEENHAMHPSMKTIVVEPAEAHTNETHRPWHHKGKHSGDHWHEHGKHRSHSGPSQRPPPPHRPPPHSPPHGHGPPPHWHGHHEPPVQSGSYVLKEEDPLENDHLWVWNVEAVHESHDDGERRLSEWGDEAEQ
ncbi:hypothetical protein N0V93_008297 [Gnomoniopsis smithogilvyi]|uniref:Uncharacterized protein n=1 Tax=Gnomoniopsis smithogilvyi TaxID=1191159 RepID=A0A9W8YNW3_9PEZI|nr:hypothetical protein N0V93_008297 [Gnomoniopsis smithogilvyi]